MNQGLTAILPCNDLDAAQAFFERLGFNRDDGSPDDYRLLSDGLGGFIHLNKAGGGMAASRTQSVRALSVSRGRRWHRGTVCGRDHRDGVRQALGYVRIRAQWP